MAYSHARRAPAHRPGARGPGQDPPRGARHVRVRRLARLGAGPPRRRHRAAVPAVRDDRPLLRRHRPAGGPDLVRQRRLRPAGAALDRGRHRGRGQERLRDPRRDARRAADRGARSERAAGGRARPPDADPPSHDARSTPDILRDAAGAASTRGPTRRKEWSSSVAGLAGLVAAFELQAAGPPSRSCSRPRTGSAGASTRCGRSRPGLYAEAGGDAHPARPRPDAGVLRALRPAMRPFVMGNPKGLVHVGGVRMTMAEANARPGARCHSTVADAASVGGPRTSCGRRPSATCARRWRRRARRPGTTSSREYDQYSLYEFLRSEGWSRRRHRVLRGHELRRGGHAQRASSRCCARTSAAPTSTCRRSRAAWTAARTRSTRALQDEVRLGCRGVRHRAGPRRRHGPLQDRGRPVHGRAATTPSCTLPVPGAAHGRGRRPTLSTTSDARSGSSTTTPRPRSCSRSGSAIWETDDGISAARR